MKDKNKIKHEGFSVLLLMILICIYLTPSKSLSVKLTMDTSSSDSTISTYNTNVGDCSCNIHQSTCDIFCCCDTVCSDNQRSTWNTNNQCLNSGQSIERSCDQLNQGGFLSFQDLACVYYSNRGNISYFYSYPDAGTINYPTPNKFVSVASTASAINVLSSTATTDAYSSSQYLVKMTQDAALKYLQIWSPVAGGICNVGYVNISKSQSFSCQYVLNANTCVTNYQLFKGVIKLCLNGDCSTSFNLPTVPASTVTGGTTCNNFITEQKIDLTVSSTGSSYIIDSISITFTKHNVDFSVYRSYQIKTSITVINPASTVSYSGCPGYLLNKPVKMETSTGNFTLFNIADASGNCLATGTQKVDILFGQNAAYSCVTSNPCASALYIDKLANQQTLKLQKWARWSSETIQVSGTSTTINTCNSQTITMNILYTNAGWIADMQNYIIGAQITTQNSVQSSWNRKFLKINWVFVDPSTISTPPTNQFYSYFSYLWKPLREYFGVY